MAWRSSNRWRKRRSRNSDKARQASLRRPRHVPTHPSARRGGGPQFSRKTAVSFSGKYRGGSQRLEILDDLADQREQVSNLGFAQAFARMFVGVGSAGHQGLLQGGAGRGQKDVDLATVGGVAHAGGELCRFERIQDRGR